MALPLASWVSMLHQGFGPDDGAPADPLGAGLGADKATELRVGHRQVKTEWHPHLGFVSDGGDVVLEELGLLPQCVRIALTACGKAAVGAIGGIGGPLLSLPVVVGIGQVDPQAAIVLEHPPDLIEDVEQMAHELVGMGLVAELAFPAVWPGRGGAVAPEQIERRGGECDLDRVVRKAAQAAQRVAIEYLQGFVDVHRPFKWLGALVQLGVST